MSHRKGKGFGHGVGALRARLPQSGFLHAIGAHDAHRNPPALHGENPPKPIVQCQLCSYVPKHPLMALDMGLCRSVAACRKRQREGDLIDKKFSKETDNVH